MQQLLPGRLQEHTPSSACCLSPQVSIALISFLETMLLIYLSYKVSTTPGGCGHCGHLSSVRPSRCCQWALPQGMGACWLPELAKGLDLSKRHLLTVLRRVFACFVWLVEIFLWLEPIGGWFLSLGAEKAQPQHPPHCLNQRFVFVAASVLIQSVAVPSFCQGRRLTEVPPIWEKNGHFGKFCLALVLQLPGKARHQPACASILRTSSRGRGTGSILIGLWHTFKLFN